MLVAAQARLEWLRADPARNARYAMKVMIKYLMLVPLTDQASARRDAIFKSLSEDKLTKAEAEALRRSAGVLREALASLQSNP